MKKEPTKEELIDFANFAQKFQPRALEICRKHGFIFDNLDDQWQKLAFTFYSDICEINLEARRLFDDEPWKQM